MSSFEQQLNKIQHQSGFIAALDQSGGSTPKALQLYGVNEDAYNNDEEMFDAVHAMRTRIVTSNSFDGSRILGAILFEDTLDRDINDINSAKFLWEEKNIVPFLKVDKGLADEANGVQLMKPMPDLDQLLSKAKSRDVFGTKMRSVIKSADTEGISAIVQQQFTVGKQICAAGLVPIIEPEVDIHCQNKEEAETMLRDEILQTLNLLDENELVMLKLTLPEHSNFYQACTEHKNVVKVVALSGGYSREEANLRLSNNNNIVASFSRALTAGLSAQQSDSEFDATLDSTIGTIFQASNS